jgi:two-component system OmpR family sensor kinase
MFDSLRTRLTFWYASALTLMLLIFSAGVYVLVERTLYEHLDNNLHSTLETVSAALASQKAAHSTEISLTNEVLANLHFPNQQVAFVDDEGQVIGEKREGGVAHLRFPPKPFDRGATAHFYELPESGPDADDGCRGVYQRVNSGSLASTRYVVVTQSLENVKEPLDVFQNTLAVAAFLSLLLAGLGGWLLTGRTLAPVATMAESTQQITAENLEERLPVANPRDELGRLASNFNSLLARLSASFAQQRQFMADASHQLRTPLSIMRTAAQVTLERTQRQEGEYRDALAIIEQQTQRLSRIVEDMFTLARADSGGIVAQVAELYLDEVLTEAAHDATVLATRKGIKLEGLPLTEARYRGDEGLLRQMFINLLDNAVNYTPAGGVVRVALDEHPSEYRISISDTGVGIPAEAQPHIFERFFRVEKAGTQGANRNGAGLGLSIARWIAEVHKGRLELQHSDETGSTFAVYLPR